MKLTRRTPETRAAYLLGYNTGMGDILRSLDGLIDSYAARIAHDKERIAARLGINDYLEAWVIAEEKDRFERVVDSLTAIAAKHRALLKALTPTLGPK